MGKLLHLSIYVSPASVIICSDMSDASSITEISSKVILYSDKPPISVYALSQPDRQKINAADKIILNFFTCDTPPYILSDHPAKTVCPFKLGVPLISSTKRLPLANTWSPTLSASSVNDLTSACGISVFVRGAVQNNNFLTYFAPP